MLFKVLKYCFHWLLIIFELLHYQFNWGIWIRLKDYSLSGKDFSH